MKTANSLMSGLGTTVFEVMSALARQHQSVNLGQGFPDDKGPEAVRRAAADYLIDGHNQYPPMMGLPELRQAVAAHAKRFHGLEVDWQSEVLVTSGATEALGDCLFGLIEPGDEVVLIEPLYDCYLPIVRRAGGDRRSSSALDAADWSLDARGAGGGLQRPHQGDPVQQPDEPGGEGVRSRRAGADRRRSACSTTPTRSATRSTSTSSSTAAGISRCMTLPGMRERTVAHRLGRQELLAHRLEGRLRHGRARAARADRQDAPVHDLHHAAQPADGGRRPGCVSTTATTPALAGDMQRKRDRLAAGAARDRLRRRCPAHGTYFVTTDFRPLGFNGTDEDFCRHITIEAGVTAVPVSAFYDQPEVAPRHFARFCFCKHDETLDAAIDRLSRYFKR